VVLVPDDDGDGPVINPRYERSDELNPTMLSEQSDIMFSEVYEIELRLQLWKQVNDDPAAASLLEKIANASRASIRVKAPTQRFASDIRDAIKSTVLTLSYRATGKARATERDVVPTDLQVRDGKIYFRGFSLKDGAYRSYRLDRVWDVIASRPLQNSGNEIGEDPDPAWIDNLFVGGRPVKIAVNEIALSIFEGLPGIRISRDDDPNYIVLEVQISDPEFLAGLLIEAGPGASVLGDDSPRAGHEQAESIRKRLRKSYGR
jgi:predicted DNA-binding transcriptional regulator YafY